MREARDSVMHQGIKLACSACQSHRRVRKLDEHIGFCRDCLDRSRVVADYDLGGEA